MFKKTREALHRLEEFRIRDTNKLHEVERRLNSLIEILINGEILSYEMEPYDKTKPPKLVSRIEHSHFGRITHEARDTLLALIDKCGYEIAYRHSHVELVKKKRNKGK